jgi:chromosome segregation ATPase
LVDLEARLSNLRAERDRLRTLYERANTTEDVLAVQRELSEVQGEIERLEAQKRSLEQRVAYSTLTVELREPGPVRDYVREEWYDTPVLEAFLESVNGVLVVGRALVVAFAYALPYIVAFFAPLAVLAAVAWRFRHRLPI